MNPWQQPKPVGYADLVVCAHPDCTSLIPYQGPGDATPTLCDEHRDSEPQDEPEG